MTSKVTKLAVVSSVKLVRGEREIQLKRSRFMVEKMVVNPCILYVNSSTP